MRAYAARTDEELTSISTTERALVPPNNPIDYIVTHSFVKKAHILTKCKKNVIFRPVVNRVSRHLFIPTGAGRLLEIELMAMHINTHDISFLLESTDVMDVIQKAIDDYKDGGGTSHNLNLAMILDNPEVVQAAAVLKNVTLDNITSETVALLFDKALSRYLKKGGDGDAGNLYVMTLVSDDTGNTGTSESSSIRLYTYANTTVTFKRGDQTLAVVGLNRELTFGALLDLGGVKLLQGERLLEDDELVHIDDKRNPNDLSGSVIVLAPAAD